VNSYLKNKIKINLKKKSTKQVNIKDYLDLHEEIPEVFLEACKVLVQMEESLRRHFKLGFRQVREGILK